MWLDLLALLILAAFAAAGALRGALATIMGLVSLVLGYTAAILLAPSLGPALAESLDWPEILAIPAAGTGVFFATYFCVGLVTALIRKFGRRRDGLRSVRDRFLGGVFGAVRGGLIVLLVSWLALWVDALRVTGAFDGLPEIGASTAAAVTGDVVESGIEAALGEEGGSAGRMVARMAGRPGAAIVEFQSVLEHPSVMGLRGDDVFWTYVDAGSIDAALNRSSFNRIAHDPDLRQRFADLGLVEPSQAADPGAFRDATADVFRQVAPRIRGLTNDPAVQALVEDPEVVAMLQSGDTMGLLRHPGFRDLVDRVTTSAP